MGIIPENWKLGFHLRQLLLIAFPIQIKFADVNRKSKSVESVKILSNDCRFGMFQKMSLASNSIKKIPGLKLFNQLDVSECLFGVTENIVLVNQQFRVRKILSRQAVGPENPAPFGFSSR